MKKNDDYIKMMIEFSSKVSKEPQSYINSYVAYLDILGFKEIIRQRSEKDIKNIYDEIRFIASIYCETDLFDLSNEVRKNLNISFLSDSIIINIPKNIPYAFSGLVAFCLNVQFKLIGLKKLVLIRGAISQGNFFRYYDSKTGAVIIFGDSVVDTHRLEDREAVYPRIILDETLNKLALNELSGGNLSILKNFIKKDEDNYFILDYMKMRMDFGNDINTKCTQIKEYIQSELIKQTDEKILHKLEWLKKYFNSTIKESNYFLNNNTVDEMIII